MICYHNVKTTGIGLNLDKYTWSGSIGLCRLEHIPLIKREDCSYRLSSSMIMEIDHQVVYGFFGRMTPPLHGISLLTTHLERQ